MLLLWTLKTIFGCYCLLKFKQFQAAHVDNKDKFFVLAKFLLSDK